MRESRGGGRGFLPREEGEFPLPPPAAAGESIKWSRAPNLDHSVAETSKRRRYPGIHRVVLGHIQVSRSLHPHRDRTSDDRRACTRYKIAFSNPSLRARLSGPGVSRAHDCPFDKSFNVNRNVKEIRPLSENNRIDKSRVLATLVEKDSCNRTICFYDNVVRGIQDKLERISSGDYSVIGPSGTR